MASTQAFNLGSHLSLSYLLGQAHNPRQAEFILSPEFEVAWVGGMGCGKTYALCVAAIRHCTKFPGARVLLARLTFRELIDSTKHQFFEVVENKQIRGAFSRPQKWDYREGTNSARLKNGSEIMFANLEPNKLDKLKNLEFSFVGIDQAEEIQFETVQLLLQRCRYSGVPATERHVMLIANDEGDNWLRRRYLTFEAPHGRPTAEAGRKLIRGSSLDNPHLDSGARAQLLALPPEMQSRWVFATMDAGSSRLIPDFNIIEPFEIPRHWPRWLGVDPARSTGTTCALWLTANPDDKEYHGVAPNAPHFYQEYWAEGREAEAHADAINERTGPHKLRGYSMDQTSWQSGLSSRRLGTISVAQLYINAGLPVTPSDGDEWARVMLFLEAQRRGLTISKACYNLIRQGPEYRIKGQWGAFGPLKIPAKSKFHAIDAGGYALGLLPTKLQPVDIREIREAFDISKTVDDGSLRHWEQWRKHLPKRKGNESIVTTGYEDTEMVEEVFDPDPFDRQQGDLDY